MQISDFRLKILDYALGFADARFRGQTLDSQHSKSEIYNLKSAILNVGAKLDPKSIPLGGQPT
ncbi:MAG: hypothetical protein DMF69_10310 [Acidobacteria bacterium]|nr:MAG: hypothetical protein DMF69_10310 [Acidobacteriota bacterium]